MLQNANYNRENDESTDSSEYEINYVAVRTLIPVIEPVSIPCVKDRCGYTTNNEKDNKP